MRRHTQDLGVWQRGFAGGQATAVLVGLGELGWARRLDLGNTGGALDGSVSLFCHRCWKALLDLSRSAASCTAVRSFGKEEHADGRT